MKLDIIKNLFYPILAFDTIKTNILTPFQFNDKQYVVSKNIFNEPNVYLDECPHRGMSFANQNVNEDLSFKCPYHGFEFDKEGVLQKGYGVKAKCSKLEKLNAINDNGILWVSKSNEAQKPFSFHKDEKDSSFITIKGCNKIDCNYEFIVLNIIDVLHISYVHSFGNENSYPRNFKVRDIDEYSAECSFTYLTGGGLWRKENVKVTNFFHLPTTVGTRVERENGEVKTLIAHVTPDSKLLWKISRNFLVEPIFNPIIDIMMKYTLNEDKSVLEHINTNEIKCHSYYDQLQRLYFKKKKHLLSLEI